MPTYKVPEGRDSLDLGDNVHAHIETSPQCSDHGKITYTYLCSPISRGWAEREFPDLPAIEKTLTAHLHYVNALVRKGRKTPIYRRLMEICKDTGWPAHYKTDVTWHDARYLGQVNPARVIVALRCTGSWIYSGLDSTPTESAITYELTQGDSRYFYITDTTTTELHRDKVVDKMNMLYCMFYTVPQEAQ